MKSGKTRITQTLLLAVFAFSIASCAGCRIWHRGGGVSSASTIASRQYVQQAVESIQQNDATDASQKLELALETNPENAEARAMYADMLWKQGRHLEAIAEMEKSVRNSEAVPDWHVKLAWMYFEEKDLSNAALWVEKGLKRDPTIADGWLLRGKIDEARGKNREAIAAYHQAIYYNPEDYRASVMLANVYLKAREPQRALETIQGTAAKFAPNQEPVEVVYAEGMALFELQRFESASVQFAAAASKNPKNPHFLEMLAESQYRAGQYDSALQTAQSGLRAFPASEPCREILTQLSPGLPAQAEVSSQYGKNVTLP